MACDSYFHVFSLRRNPRPFLLAVCDCSAGVTHQRDTLYKPSLKSLKLLIQCPITNVNFKHLPNGYATTCPPTVHPPEWHCATPEKRRPVSSQKCLYIFPGHKGLTLNRTLHGGVSEHPQGEGIDRKASSIFCLCIKNKIFPNCRMNKKKTCKAKTPGRKKEG